jgi:hypothetical protein
MLQEPINAALFTGKVRHGCDGFHGSLALNCSDVFSGKVEKQGDLASWGQL